MASTYTPSYLLGSVDGDEDQIHAIERLSTLVVDANVVIESFVHNVKFDHDDTVPTHTLFVESVADDGTATLASTLETTDIQHDALETPAPIKIAPEALFKGIGRSDPSQKPKPPTEKEIERILNGLSDIDATVEELHSEAVEQWADSLYDNLIATLDLEFRRPDDRPNHPYRTEAVRVNIEYKTDD